MIWNEIKNNWRSVSDRIRVTWGKLSDADLTAIAGDRDQLSHLIQLRYGYERDQAEQMVDEFARELSSELEPRNGSATIQRTH